MKKSIIEDGRWKGYLRIDMDEGEIMEMSFALRMQSESFLHRLARAQAIIENRRVRIYDWAGRYKLCSRSVEEEGRSSMQGENL